mgnify:CR=1 FL=1
MKTYSTQMDAAKQGIITPEMKIVAEKEYMEPEKLRELVAKGEVAIPCNINHKSISPEGIGSGLRTKINVNLGISGDCKDYSVEMQKVDMALKFGAEAIMDLSNYGKTNTFRRELIEKALITVADTVNAYGDKDYFNFLLTLIKKEKLNGKGEVYLSVKDKVRDIAAFKSELSALNLTLSDTFANINGGFILKYGDIQINGELSALIHEKRDMLTDELNKALFN